MWAPTSRFISVHVMPPFFMEERAQIDYDPLPTLELFHKSQARNRCMVGPVGSGKTSAALMEIGYYLPMYLYKTWGIKRTRWGIIRNTYRELQDSTLKSISDPETGWFPWGTHRVQKNNYDFSYPNGVQVDFWLRACDRPDQARMFKSMELTGIWFEESIEIAEEVKRLCKTRIGRVPKQSPFKCSIESTNPPDVEHPLFSDYKWITPPPDVVPTRQPLEDYEGFWQPPYENSENLGVGYYEDLKKEYRDSPDWADMYILGKPGAMVRGKLVYYDFSKEKHVSKEPLVWGKGRLYRGWDNTGNTPAAVVVQVAGKNKVQVLREFCTDRMDILDFTRWVVIECNLLWPECEYVDYADPAGESKMSSPVGGFTSNAQIMRELGVQTIPSDQNWDARKGAVQRQIGIEYGIFVDPSCSRLINGFVAGYSYPEIATTGIFKDNPSKNKYSHVHDALQYVLVKIFQSVSAVGNMRRMAAQQQAFFEQRSVAGI